MQENPQINETNHPKKQGTIPLQLLKLPLPPMHHQQILPPAPTNLLTHTIQMPKTLPLHLPKLPQRNLRIELHVPFPPHNTRQRASAAVVADARSGIDKGGIHLSVLMPFFGPRVHAPKSMGCFDFYFEMMTSGLIEGFHKLLSILSIAAALSPPLSFWDCSQRIRNHPHTTIATVVKHPADELRQTPPFQIQHYIHHALHLLLIQ
mmetsp:Transcript_2315/g.3003  ORF Transcript_2315/g.3003 Transcript_2315/m.3003 type:complete len:206 (+) Transcript_2315:68-685(+)